MRASSPSNVFVCCFALVTPALEWRTSTVVWSNCCLLPPVPTDKQTIDAHTCRMKISWRAVLLFMALAALLTGSAQSTPAPTVSRCACFSHFKILQAFFSESMVCIRLFLLLKALSSSIPEHWCGQFRSSGCCSVFVRCSRESISSMRVSKWITPAHIGFTHGIGGPSTGLAASTCRLRRTLSWTRRFFGMG